MPIELPSLPYPYDALKPYISDVTLKKHHGKHHRAYVDKTNELVTGTTSTSRSVAPPMSPGSWSPC